MKLNLLFGLLILTQTLFAQNFTEVAQLLPIENVYESSIAFADVDGDKDQDVLITGLNNFNVRISKLYTNDGMGSFSEVEGTPFDGVGYSSIAFADVDGDDDQDVLITGINNSGAHISKLYTNDGMGSFSEMKGTPFDGVYFGSIAFADVDGDDDQDVLISGGDNSDDPISKLYINKGQGSFSEVTGTPFEGVVTSSIAFADVDGDKDQDVLITGRNNSNALISKLYTNDGMGNFSEMTGTPFEGVNFSSIAFADVDGDNDQDVLITGQNNSLAPISKLYTNDGMGSFSQVTGTPFEGVEFSSIAFADVDGDKDQDVLITGRAHISKLYTNDGQGSFSELTGTPFEGVGNSSIAFADVDGDKDQDVLITGRNLPYASFSKLYINDGMGSFSEMTSPPFEGVDRSSIAFADVDGDKDQDVLITGRNNSRVRISKLYTNDGMGSFSEMTGTPFEGVGWSSIAFADVDGDKDQDVLITGINNFDVRISKLYTNDGMGSFSEMTGTPFEGVSFGSIAFADVDGDDDQDVLITGAINSRVPISKLYTNDGMGSFSEMTGTTFEGVAFSSIAFADVDGDNDQDVLITGLNYSGAPISKLYTNNGMGSFSEVEGTPFDGVGNSSIAFADVDGDDDQDVLITGRNNSGACISKLYINDGMGNFSEMTGTPFEGVNYSSIAFADVDGDNDQDVLFTGINNSGAPISKLHTNDGQGSFSEMTGTPFEGVGNSSIAFADVDGDKDQDVLITGAINSRARISKLYTNDGMISSSDDLFVNLSPSLTLFPNPAMSDKLNVSFNSTESNSIIIRLYDMNGRLISQQREFVETGEQTHVIDVTSLPTGSYFLQLENGKKLGVVKFLVQ